MKDSLIRVYNKTQDQYLKLQAFCNEMNILTDDDHEFFVKTGHFDETLDWKWSAPACKGNNGKKISEWWVLSPKEYEEIIKADSFNKIKQIADKIVHYMHDKENAIPGQKSPYGELLSDMEISVKRIVQMLEKSDEKVHVVFDEIENPEEMLIFVSNLSSEEIDHITGHATGLVNLAFMAQQESDSFKLVNISPPNKYNDFLFYAKKHGITQSVCIHDLMDVQQAKEKEKIFVKEIEDADEKEM